MAEDKSANAANQHIDTNQPRPLRGLVLRGVKTNNLIPCKKMDENGNEVTLLVNEADYDRDEHGEKLDKLPTRKKAPAKKKKAAKASAEAK